MPTRAEWLECKTRDGRRLPISECNIYRARHGLQLLSQPQPTWGVSMPSRGLGDTVAKVAHYTGAAKVVKAVTSFFGYDCGCGARQETLNKLVPFRNEEVQPP